MDSDRSSSGSRDRNDNLTPSRRELLLQLLSALDESQQPPPARTQGSIGGGSQGLYPTTSQGLLHRPQSAQLPPQMPSQSESLDLLLARSLNPQSRPSHLAPMSGSQSYLPPMHNSSLAPLGPSEEELLTRLLISRLQRSNREALMNELWRSSGSASLGNDREIEALLRLHRAGHESLPSSLSSLHGRMPRGSLGSGSGMFGQASAGGLGGAYPHNMGAASLSHAALPPRDDFSYSQEIGMTGMLSRIESPSIAARQETETEGRRGRKRDRDRASLPAARAQDEPSSPKSVDSKEKKKKKKTVKKKPADMPRRPLSAYNLFFSEERERILREISGDDEVKDKPEESKSSDDEKKPAADAPAGAERSSSISGEEAEPSSGACRALRRPLVRSNERRPHRKTHGKIGFKNLAQMVGQRWRSLPSDRLSYYQKLAEDDMKRHKAAMEEYYKKKAKSTEGEDIGQDDTEKKKGGDK